MGPSASPVTVTERARERVAAAAVAGRRPPSVAEKPSVERRTARPVPTTPAPVARTTVASVAPLTRISPATNRNTARMSAPSVESRCDMTQNSAWPTIPPRRSKAAACQNWAAGVAPGPIPSVPAASMSVSAATRQPSPVRSGRVGGRSSRMRIEQPRRRPGRRDGVAEGAEHEPGGADRAVAERAAGPVQVGDAAQEDPDRDQGQGEDVDVMGLERRPSGSVGRLASIERLRPRRG